VLGSSQKIGRYYKTVEFHDSKFGRRKYNSGHKVNGQSVFYGVKLEPGETFLFHVPERNAYRLTAVLRDLIKPNTTFINDCWST
jgi:hypothetical protein